MLMNEKACLIPIFNSMPVLTFIYKIMYKIEKKYHFNKCFRWLVYIYPFNEQDTCIHL